MIDWIGDREYKIYAWSESDRDQLLHEIKAKKMDDAVNTAYLIGKLEMNPEYQLVSYEMPEKPSEHLCCTLGEFFSGLDLIQA